jgi:hypothetical protein
MRHESYVINVRKKVCGSNSGDASAITNACAHLRIIAERDHDAGGEDIGLSGEGSVREVASTVRFGASLSGESLEFEVVIVPFSLLAKRDVMATNLDEESLFEDWYL